MPTPRIVLTQGGSMLDRNVPHGGIGVVWMRKAYMAGYQNGMITVWVRPGDRSDPTKAKGNPIGVPIPVRFIAKAGNQAMGIDPMFFPDDGTTVEITEILAKPVGELTGDDLVGAAPDYATPELVKYHLAIVYDTELLGDDDVVTVFRCKHLPKVTESE